MTSKKMRKITKPPSAQSIVMGIKIVAKLGDVVLRLEFRPNKFLSNKKRLSLIKEEFRSRMEGFMYSLPYDLRPVDKA